MHAPVSEQTIGPRTRALDDIFNRIEFHDAKDLLP